MTTDEKIVSKGEVLDECAAFIRHTVRHNGAALSARAGLGEVTAHLTETSAARVQTLVRDICSPTRSTIRASPPTAGAGRSCASRTRAWRS